MTEPVGTSSGFAFVDQYGYRTGAVNSNSPGVIQKVDLSTGVGKSPTRMVEAPVLGTTGAVFTRTIAVLPDRSNLVNLTTSGFTVLPWNYDASVAIPQIRPGGQRGRQDSGRRAGRSDHRPGPGSEPGQHRQQGACRLPLALGESCLTVNGLAVPMLMVSSTQINAQLPFQAEGNVTMLLRTPGGVSDNFNLTILPTAPSVFRTNVTPDYEAATIVRVAVTMRW